MLKDIKILKNSAFKDNRGMLWTTWKKGVFKNIKFNHDTIASVSALTFFIILLLIITFVN